jgi:hypothetical protein
MSEMDKEMAEQDWKMELKGMDALCRKLSIGAQGD